MSCDKCDNEPLRGAFYRWGTATVEIIACKKHWLEIREVLNKAQVHDSKKKYLVEEKVLSVLINEELGFSKDYLCELAETITAEGVSDETK